jgi:hypothetical protein
VGNNVASYLLHGDRRQRERKGWQFEFVRADQALNMHPGFARMKPRDFEELFWLKGIGQTLERLHALVHQRICACVLARASESVPIFCTFFSKKKIKEALLPLRYFCMMRRSLATCSFRFYFFNFF